MDSSFSVVTVLFIMSSYFIRQFIYVLLGSKVCQIAFKWWPSWARETWSLPGWCAFYVVLLGRRDFLYNEEAGFSLVFLLFPWGDRPLTRQRIHVVFLNFPFLCLSNLNVFYMYGYFVSMYVCVPLVCCLESMKVRKELELRTFMSHHMGARNWTPVLWESSQDF